MFVSLGLACSGPGADPTDGPAPHTFLPDTGPTGPGEVATVDVPDSFAPTGGGAYTLGTGFEIFDVSRAFYETHEDAYDVLVIWTDFEVEGIWQFALSTRADIGGIGQAEVYAEYGWGDFTEDSGSSGRLQHLVFMNHRGLWDDAAFTHQEILAHEVGHRWAAYVHLPGAADPWILQDASKSHWSVVASTGGPSALGYGELRDLGGGSFLYDIVRPLRYSSLELYAMGLLDAADVPDLWYVADADIDPDRYGETVSFHGTRVDLPLAEVVTALGPRDPPAGVVTTWTLAGVVVCPPQGCAPETVAWATDERDAFTATFAEATGNRGTIVLPPG